MSEYYLSYEGLQRYDELIRKEIPTTMGASGTNHKGGLVPDPGSTAGTSKYLREDGTWQNPSVTYGNVSYSMAGTLPNFTYGYYTSASGSVTVGNDPITLITADGDISSVVINPAYAIHGTDPSTSYIPGHSYHVIILNMASSDISVSMEGDVAIFGENSNNGQVLITYRTPTHEDVSLTIPQNGYAEIDILYLGLSQDYKDIFMIRAI